MVDGRILLSVVSSGGISGSVRRAVRKHRPDVLDGAA